MTGSWAHLSNEKKGPCLVGDDIGDEKLPSYMGDYFISHEIFGIPFLTNQDFMESRRVFLVAHLEDHPRT